MTEADENKHPKKPSQPEENPENSDGDPSAAGSEQATESTPSTQAAPELGSDKAPQPEKNTPAGQEESTAPDQEKHPAPEQEKEPLQEPEPKRINQQAQPERVPPPASSQTATYAASHAAPQPPKRRYVGIAILSLLVIVLSALLIVGGYYAQQQLQQQNDAIALLSSEIATASSNSERAMTALDQKQNKSTSAMTGLEENITAAKRELTDLSQRVSTQAKRLRAMSDTSREDWLLAEAEYLLKLANQRVLIERNATGAEALLAEADGILRDMEDPDLYPLRRAIAQDLAALRLMNKVDVEGIYLTLVALSEQVAVLPLRRHTRPEEPEPVIEKAQEVETPQNFTSKLAASWQGFVASLGNTYRVIPKDQQPKRILPPEANLYLQQNLRMIMERAQLALMREHADIYKDSLGQAQTWVHTYFDQTPSSASFLEELERLRNKDIVLTFPDISYSLGLLHDYIDDLHQLKDVNIRPAAARAAQKTSGSQQSGGSQP